MRGSISALLLAAAAPVGAQPAAPPPPACESAEHKQFDFWVGKWDVYRPDTNQLVAHSLIEKLYAGCAVRENWIPLNGSGDGGSLNSYRPEEKKWRQVYTGAANGWSEFSGGMEGEAMVLVGTQSMPNGSKTPVRIIYKRGEAGSVHQIGEQTSDGGKTWQLRYHFVYRPAKP